MKNSIKETEEYQKVRNNILQNSVNLTLTEYMQDLKTRIKYGKQKLKSKKPFDKKKAKQRLQAYIDLYNEAIEEI